MESLLEIFEGTNEKARLATTLIATAAALIVVFLTHWFTGRRSRSELKLQKLEQIYKLSIEYRKNAKILLSIPSVISNRGIKLESDKGEHDTPDRDREQLTTSAQKRSSVTNRTRWQEYKSSREEMEVMLALYVPDLERHLKSMDVIICRATLPRTGNKFRTDPGPPPAGVEDDFQSYKSHFYANLSKFDQALLNKVRKRI